MTPPLDLKKLRELANTHTSRFPVIALLDTIEEMASTIRFYSIEAKYEPLRQGEVGSISHDFGKRAREALDSYKRRFKT